MSKQNAITLLKLNGFHPMDWSNSAIGFHQLTAEQQALAEVLTGGRVINWEQPSKTLGLPKTWTLLIHNWE